MVPRGIQKMKNEKYRPKSVQQQKTRGKSVSTAPTVFVLFASSLSSYSTIQSVHFRKKLDTSYKLEDRNDPHRHFTKKIAQKIYISQ